MHRSYFDELNQQQREVIRSPLQPILCIAGPGTGKTRTLVGRVLALLDEPYNFQPEDILAVTFTNQAATEMRERIEDIVGARALRIRISTIHSFCLHVLQSFPDIGYVPKDFIIADEMTQFRLLSRCTNCQDVTSLHHVRDIISQRRLGLAFPVEVEESTIDSWIERYEAQLKRHRMIDFDQMVLFTRDILMMDEEICNILRTRYRAILIDEFQDIDAVQYHIFKLLAEQHKNIFVVCDEDQSIYAFRGANIQQIYQFKDEFSPTIISLQNNYRNPQAVTQLSDTLMRDFRVFPKEIISTKTLQEPPKIHTCHDETEEHDLIINLVTEYHNKGIAYSDIAVLCPTNFLATSLEHAFISEHIPYKISTKDTVSDYNHLQRLKAYLTVVMYRLNQDTQDKAFQEDIYDLAYEYLFILESGLSAHTFTLIKYRQLRRTFHQTLDELYEIATTPKLLNEWDLDIQPDEFERAYVNFQDVVTLLLSGITTEMSLTEILGVIEPFLPIQHTELLFACGDVLKDSRALTESRDNVGLFCWFMSAYQPGVEKDVQITITCADHTLGQTLQYMLSTVLKTHPNTLISTCPIDIIDYDTLGGIRIDAGDPEIECHFSGVYTFFKFLQALYFELHYTEIFTHYVGVASDKEGWILYEIKNGTILHSFAIQRPQDIPFDDFMYDNRQMILKSDVITDLLANDLPILYIEERSTFKLFHALFPENVAMHFFGIPSLLKTQDAYKEMQFDPNNHLVSILRAVDVVNSHGKNKFAKTCLDYLVPALTLGMYREYVLYPQTKGKNFVTHTESNALFIWGFQNIDQFVYSEWIRTQLKDRWHELQDFVSMLDTGDIQVPFDQSFASVLMLSTKYHHVNEENPSVLEDIRAFVNDIALIGTGQFVDTDRVPINTIHASKGKEYYVVILCGLNQGLLPSSHSLRFRSGHGSTYLIDEQRRVLYVALTRTQRHLHVITNTTRGGRKTQPSQFLQDLHIGDA